MKKAIAGACCFLLSLGSAFSQSVRVEQLRCEHLQNPMGIGILQPRLSWQLVSNQQGEAQTAYEIRAASTAAGLSAPHPNFWDSGEVVSDQSILVPWAGKPLGSRSRVFWQVRIWDQNNQLSAWSTPAFFELGLVSPTDWKGLWITSDLPRYVAAPPTFVGNNTTGPGRYLRKAFTVAKPVALARLYSTALGVYEASINGQRVTDALLNPGWTDYNKRVMVQTADVTRLIVPGSNALGVILGDGWYAGRLGWMGLAQYGPRPAFSAQLEITYTDGSSAVVLSDGSWKAGSGEILGSDAQWGEVIDRRRAYPAWDRPYFEDASWGRALVEPHAVVPVPARGPPVRRLQELAPQRITRVGDTWIVDLGQNMVGHVRLAASGPAGTTIRVRHAEMLNADGSLYTANLRPALATDTFVLSGGPDREIFEPHFTFHGFRYVEVAGYPGTLHSADLRGVVVGSETLATGTFDSSNPELNRLHENIVWGQRGNFLSVPTDCPQRDERMGWMGDAEVFAPTAVCNADVAAFFDKWLVDVDDGQGPQGDFANFSPRVNAPQPGMAAWGDAGVICPWVMYSAYGDKAFLADHYSAMVRWVEYCRLHSEGLLRPASGSGDDLNPGVPTPLDVIATAYFAHSAQLLAKAAAALDRTGDAAKYDRLFHEVAAAFSRAYATRDGALKADTQTAYLLALEFELLPENLRTMAAARLARLVETQGHLTTGFIGAGLICPVLTAIDRSDLAWRLLLDDSYPSWLYPVKHGATFNHDSLGSVGAWLYSGAAGIQSDEGHPGYKHFFLRPQFTTLLSRLGASIDSPYGTISSRWRTEGDLVRYDVVVPPNSSAELTLPVPPREVRQTGERIAADEATVTRLSLAAGIYHFSFPRELLRAVDVTPR